VLQAEPSENRPNWYSHPGELIGATVGNDNDVIIMVQNVSIEKLGAIVVAGEFIMLWGSQEYQYLAQRLRNELKRF